MKCNVTSWDDVPVLMDLAYASRIVGLCPDYLKQLSIKGTFPAGKIGNCWRVSKESLIEYMERRGVLPQNTRA